MLAFWNTIIRDIVFGPIAVNDTDFFILDIEESRILKYNKDDVYNGIIAPSILNNALTLDPESRIQCVGTLLIVSTSNGFYHIDATTGIAIQINSHTETDGSSFSVFDFRISGTLDDWLFVVPQGDVGVIRKYNISSIPQATFTTLDSSEAGLDASLQVKSLVCSETKLFAWEYDEEGGVLNNSFQVDIGTAPPFTSLAPVVPGGGIGLVRTATELYNDLEAGGSTVPVVFYTYANDNDQVNPLPYGISSFTVVPVPADVTTAHLCIVKNSTPTPTELYILYPIGVGLAMIGYCTGGGEGSTGSFTQIYP